MPRPPRPRAAAPHGARRSQRRITAGDPTKMLGRAATQAGSLSSVTIPRPGHAVEPAAGPELLMMMAPGSDLWTSTEKEGRRERGRRRAFACCARAQLAGALLSRVLAGLTTMTTMTTAIPQPTRGSPSGGTHLHA